MEIFPAIDLRDGKVVRLTEGNYDKMTVYSDSPLKIAESFMEKGAKNLHVVDLDGARDGTMPNFETIKKLASLKELFIEVGGGIRSMERIERYLETGVKRTILGTIAARNYNFVEDAVRKFGGAVAVGVDAKDSMVAISGWQEKTNIDSVAFCERLKNSGVKTVIYTDISKDGTLSGTNLDIYKKLSAIKGLNIIASGGVTFEEEIVSLSQMGIYGAIVGKAIYSGRLSLERVLMLAKEENR
jgi:phosphoribosylformimino-5-aminoimidazole carboxamide ribotide isomerase